MVKLVALVGQRHRMDHLTIGGRSRLYIDHGERVGFREVRAEQQGVGEALRRSFDRKLRRSIKCGVGSDRHCTASLFCVDVQQHGSEVLPLRVGSSLKKKAATNQFYLIVTVIFCETTGGLNG